MFRGLALTNKVIKEKKKIFSGRRKSKADKTAVKPTAVQSVEDNLTVPSELKLPGQRPVETETEIRKDFHQIREVDIEG